MLCDDVSAVSVFQDALIYISPLLKADLCFFIAASWSEIWNNFSRLSVALVRWCRSKNAAHRWCQEKVSDFDVRCSGFFKRQNKVNLEKHWFSKNLCLLNCTVTAVVFEVAYLYFASASLRALLPCQRNNTKLMSCSLQLHFLHSFTHDTVSDFSNTYFYKIYTCVYMICSFCLRTS